MVEPPATVELSLCLSERVETVVGQACENLIAHVLFCFLSYLVQLLRALSQRRGCSITRCNMFFVFSFF